MAGEAAAAMTAITTLQYAFYLIATNEDMTAYQYPKQVTVEPKANFDHIVVGVGTAGCVMAARLSQYANVMAIEAGVNSPLEAQMVATFPLQGRSFCDYNMTSTNDESIATNVQDNALPVTIGKMVGGTGDIDHMYSIQGVPDDYDLWATAANDSSWNYEGLLPYFMKAENILNGTVSNMTFHGTNGPISIYTEENVYNVPLFGAFEEMGYPEVDDISGLQHGACKPFIKAFSDKTRATSSRAYIANTANRNNLSLVTNATVTRLLIDSNNNVTGVEYIDSTGETKYAYSNREVIVSCGGVLTPKLLMNSGIGPKEDLEAAGITVVADLPVGQRMQDHNMVLMVHTLNATDEDEPPTNPNTMNTGMTTVYMNYENGTDKDSDYHAMNILFWKKTNAMFQMCLNAFLFTEDFCQGIYDGAGDHMYIVTGVSPRFPETYGSVKLTAEGDVKVNYGYYKDERNLYKTANATAHYHRSFLSTTYAKAVGSEMVTMGACGNHTFDTPEFWQCYAPKASVPMWHYIGTCAMGTVTDNNMRPKGVGNLMVADASVVPSPVRGKIGASIIAISEKLADYIIKLYNYSSS